MDDNFNRNVLGVLGNQTLDAEILIRVLKCHPTLHRCYERPLGGVDGLTLHDHTLNVMRCFERHFEGRSALLFGPQYFKLLLAFHDLGKPQAASEKHPEKQHEYTLGIIKSISAEVKLPPQVLRSIITIINADPIGRYLNRKFRMPLGISLQQIGRMANDLRVPVVTLWPTLLVYYQCDAAGYESLKNKVFVTDDTGEIVYSDRLGRFEFKNTEEAERFAILESSILGLNDQG